MNLKTKILLSIFIMFTIQSVSYAEVAIIGGVGISKVIYNQDYDYTDEISLSPGIYAGAEYLFRISSDENYSLFASSGLFVSQVRFNYEKTFSSIGSTISKELSVTSLEIPLEFGFQNNFTNFLVFGKAGVAMDVGVHGKRVENSQERDFVFGSDNESEIINSYSITQVGGTNFIGGLVGAELRSTTRNSYWEVEGFDSKRELFFKVKEN